MCVFGVCVGESGEQKKKNSDVMPESHLREGLIVLGIVWASEF